MVYNRDSVWFHLYAAYQRVILDGAFPGLDLDAAFARTTDGPECPIARAWRREEFGAICERAGLEAEHIGGYPSLTEIDSLEQHWAGALADPQLAGEQRDFLRALTFDRHGYPMHRGSHAGIGGVYRLRRP